MNALPNNPEQGNTQDVPKVARYERRILEALPIGALITRIGDGKVLFANPASAHLLGYADVADLLKMQSPNFYWDSTERQVLLDHFRAQGSLENYQVRFRRADDSMIWVSISVRSFEFEGEANAILSTIANITESKRMEDALSESEERLRALYDNASVGLYRTTPDGRILSINPTGIHMLGYNTFEEIANRDLEETGFEEDNARKEFSEKLEKDGIVVGLESKWIRKDGSTIIVSESSKAFHDETGKILYYDGSFEDITVRKQAEQALQERQQLLQLVIDNIPQSVFWKDKKLIYLGANRAFAKDAGFDKPQDLIGKTDFDMPWKEQADLYRADDQYVLNTGNGKINFEEPQARPSGKTTWLNTSKIPLRDAGGNIFSVLGLYEDITERKQAEQIVRESEQRFRTVTDFTYDWEYWLTPDGKFTYISPSCERISGYRPEEFEHDPGLLAKLISPEDHAAWEEHIRAYHGAHSLEIGEVNLRITTRAGNQRWIAHVCQAVHDTQGDWQGRRASNRDITERKRLESEIQETLERRGYQVQVSTEISQEVATAANINDLFDRVVTLTRERLGYYHTQLLRYDAAQDAVVLINGYGETGQKMLASGHKLPMGTGLIGTAAASGKTVLRPSLAEDLDWQPNPLLPDTKGEIAVPIKLGEQILGVLDVQSDRAGALAEDDRLLLEGLCGQVAVAIEGTRLRQEMAERLEEVNRLYQSMSREGWKTYRESENLPVGFIFDQTNIKSVDDDVLLDEFFANIPMKVLGGEVVGTLSIANDPLHPTSTEDRAFLQQVSEQIALALESARLTAQTQSALAQSEILFESSRRLAQASDLQELLKTAIETFDIPVINGAELDMFNYDLGGELESLAVAANWWNGTGKEPGAIGSRYPKAMFSAIKLFLTTTPVAISDALDSERVDASMLRIVQAFNIRAVTFLPLFVGTHQIGVLVMHAEEPHNFTEEETRLFSGLAPQIATVLENRRQFERAQKQAERESALNVISQKIQSATTVEAVLQIAARELGHALGAPMTIAQLSMKDKK